MNNERSKNISPLQQVKRKFVSFVVPIVVRQEINPVVPDGLTQAIQLVKQGYGLIVAYNHFSKRDGADIMSFILNQPVLGKRPIISPIAYHQYDRHPWANKLNKFSTIETHPIITEDARKESGYTDRTLNEGWPEYLTAGVKGLEKGVIVPIALQAGRRATLYEEKPTAALSSIMRVANFHKVNNYGVLFVGLELPGVENYYDVRDYNLFKKFRLNVGGLFTADQIFNQVGKRHEIDVWAYDQLAQLVPESYRRKKT